MQKREAGNAGEVFVCLLVQCEPGTVLCITRAGKTRSIGSGGYSLGKMAEKSSSALGAAAGSGCPGPGRLQEERLVKPK